jgi:hypothetical protein
MREVVPFLFLFNIKGVETHWRNGHKECGTEWECSDLEPTCARQMIP